jgi:hypothetical protein
LELYGRDDIIWHPSLESRILVSIGSFGFILIIGFGLIILVKYLFIRSECKRVQMIGFYMITISNLIVRLAIMVSLNWRTFFATENLILSTISLMLTLMTGTSQTQILTTLLIDLETLKCTSQEEYDKTLRLKKRLKIAIFSWIFFLVGSSVFFFFSAKYEYIMLGYVGLFTLQAIGLLSLNCMLNSTLTGIFAANSFTKERRFL